jgi:hypothetical protein
MQTWFAKKGYFSASLRLSTEPNYMIHLFNKMTTGHANMIECGCAHPPLQLFTRNMRAAQAVTRHQNDYWLKQQWSGVMCMAVGDLTPLSMSYGLWLHTRYRIAFCAEYVMVTFACKAKTVWFPVNEFHVDTYKRQVPDFTEPFWETIVSYYYTRFDNLATSSPFDSN